MIIKEDFYSTVLNEEKRYQIVVPYEYNDLETRYPVLYLLHGADQNYQSWTKYTFLEVLAEQYPFIIAIPDCVESWYLDLKTGITRNRDYILEFVAHVDKNYRTIASRRNRGVGGISMGGYASFLVGFESPELFGSISALSGVFDITNHWNVNFKPDQIISERHSVLRNFHLFDIAKKLIRYKMKFLFDSGTKDELSYENSCNLSLILRDLHIPHIFNEYPGEHDWHYWDAHFQEHLDFHRQCFAEEAAEK